MSRRTETAYETTMVDVPNGDRRAHFARLWRKFTFLSGPAALACPRRGGDLLDMQLDRVALRVATFVVIGKESAEAIVACQKRRAKHELGEGADEFL